MICGPILLDIFINVLDNGVEGTLRMQAIQNWEMWLTDQMVGLPFRGTLTNGRNGLIDIMPSSAKGILQRNANPHTLAYMVPYTSIDGE